MTAIVSSPQLPGYPPLTININTEKPKEADKKDDKKSQSQAYLPGRVLYLGLEFYLVHQAMLTFDNQLYRETYLASMAAGTAFGLYKSMTTGKDVDLERRAESFAKSDLINKVFMTSEAYIMGTPMIRLTLRVTERLGNLMPFVCGFSIGSDVSSYLYKNLIPKKIKS
ncbi:MAG: hypothetical protein H0X29_03020 [Parachlamydiaceae bacterium]|nr:hypothetical protein [Parachlamydiaceae bacterium]